MCSTNFLWPLSTSVCSRATSARIRPAAASDCRNSTTNAAKSRCPEVGCCPLETPPPPAGLGLAEDRFEVTPATEDAAETRLLGRDRPGPVLDRDGPGTVLLREGGVLARDAPGTVLLRDVGDGAVLGRDEEAEVWLSDD